MGLFDRFRKRIHEVADEIDGDALSVDATTEEAKSLAPPQVSEDEWEEIDDEYPPPEQVPEQEDVDDDWDTWDDDEPIAPLSLSKKERKFLERQARDRTRAEKKAKKAMKKRGAVDVARPKGSKVDLSMMRTTTGRQLVQVKQAPKGSSKTASIQVEGGTSIDVDLGGGVVEQGGRIIKPGEALENWNGCCWSPIFHSTPPALSSTAFAMRWLGRVYERVQNFPKFWKQRLNAHFTHCSRRAIGTLMRPFRALLTRKISPW